MNQLEIEFVEPTKVRSAKWSVWKEAVQARRIAEQAEKETWAAACLAEMKRTDDEKET